MADLLLLPKRLLRISPEETRFARRGFSAADPARERLERSGAAFLEGYHAALDNPEPSSLGAGLDALESQFRGFAYEGAAMSLVLQDHLTWTRRKTRFPAFLAGPGNAHAYMLHVGAGWAFARLPWLRHRLDAALSGLDPLLRWLAVDGFGFHEGYFHPQAAVHGQRRPRAVRGYARRAFDQGVGRSLWFACGADPLRIKTTIAGFEESRRSDLWSGAGLACGYAGSLTVTELGVLAGFAGECLPDLAQGVAFAAQTRRRAGNIMPHTTLACRIIWDLTVEDAAELTQIALRDLPADGAEPAYEVWRSRVRREFTALRNAAIPGTTIIKEMRR